MTITLSLKSRSNNKIIVRTYQVAEIHKNELFDNIEKYYKIIGQH